METLDDVLGDVLGTDVKVGTSQDLAGGDVGIALEQFEGFPPHETAVDADHVVHVVDVFRPARLGSRLVAPDPCGSDHVLRGTQRCRTATDAAADDDDLEGVLIHDAGPSAELAIAARFYYVRMGSNSSFETASAGQLRCTERPALAVAGAIIGCRLGTTRSPGKIRLGRGPPR